MNLSGFQSHLLKLLSFIHLFMSQTFGEAVGEEMDVVKPI